MKIKFISDLRTTAEKRSLSKNKLYIVSISVVLASLIITLITFYFWSSSYLKPENVKLLTSSQTSSLTAYLNQTYPMERGQGLKPLPYPVVNAALSINAGAAILVDASNGCVLFEKNADELIPPASITKLFVMYIVFKEIEEGNLSLDDLVSPPEVSWTVNMPSDASLMFLGQGHQVTVRELLTGLSVASGNDAALAIANKISGNTKDFIARMNYEAQALGLTHTHFDDCSGYSEFNMTTPRELAEFCRIYISRYPQSLSDYHSCKSITYPLQKNLPSWLQHKGDTMAVTQKNTNPLLGVMPGCDGLKTGFIYESGYNLALTAERNGVRFLSITMMGPGEGTTQGNYYRTLDGNTLMNFAFSAFADYKPWEHISSAYTVPTPGAKEKFVNLVPAWNNTVTVPHLYANTAIEDAASVKAEVSIPKYIKGGANLGAIYGQIQYKLGDTVLETVPLVADRNAPKCGPWGRFWGTMAALRIAGN